MRAFPISILILLFGGLTAQNEDYALGPPRDYATQPARNAAFIEVGGNAGLYSLNYDRIYLYRDTWKLSARAGIAPMYHGRQLEQGYVVEQCITLFSNPHHLEFGAGATLLRRYNSKPHTLDDYFWENLWFGIARVGYRYQSQDDNFFFRFGITPAIMSKDAEGAHPGYFQLWAGLSFGMSF